MSSVKSLSLYILLSKLEIIEKCSFVFFLNLMAYIISITMDTDTITKLTIDLSMYKMYSKSSNVALYRISFIFLFFIKIKICVLKQS